jgi:hypothetical protein
MREAKLGLLSSSAIENSRQQHRAVFIAADK